MNNRITKLFSCTLNNRVVVIETNFTEFYQLFKKIEDKCYSDRWYFEQFKESSEFTQKIEDKEYTFQRLV
jgi:hypothetical protein